VRVWQLDALLFNRQVSKSTRARLDPEQLEAEIGWLAIPSEPLDTSASTEQPAVVTERRS
jgi:hypothetical protein